MSADRTTATGPRELIAAMPGVARVLAGEERASSAWTIPAPANSSRCPSRTPGSPIRSGSTTAWPPISPGPWTSTASRATTRASCSSTRRCSGRRAARSARLLQKKLGFRTLFDVVPLDASLVRGSHGLRAGAGRGPARPDRRRAAAGRRSSRSRCRTSTGCCCARWSRSRPSRRPPPRPSLGSIACRKPSGERHNQGTAVDPGISARRRPGTPRARPCLAR